MRIGELARRAGVATSKLRFLEAHGLIPPARRLPSGYRDYDESAVEILKIVLQAQSFGFTLEEISDGFLESQGKGLRCDDIIKRLNGKLQELDRHLEQVQILRTQLTNAVAELEARRADNQKLDARARRHGLLALEQGGAAGPKPVRQARKIARV